MQSHRPNFQNRPPHVKLDISFYFITAKTIAGQWFLRPDKYKHILLEKLKEKTKKFGLDLIAYVILSNHYHLIVKITDSKVLSKFMNELNGASSFAINQADGTIRRKIWWNYFDHVVRDETDFFKTLNYIHQNPVKHGATKSFNYEFSSYNAWQKKKGVEYMNDCLEKYPIVDFMAVNDEY